MASECEKAVSPTMRSSTETSLEDEQRASSPSSPEPALEHTLTEWDSPTDAGNPRNWSLGARVFGVLVPAWYAFAV